MIFFMGTMMPAWIPLTIALILWGFWFGIAMHPQISNHFAKRRQNRRMRTIRKVMSHEHRSIH